MLVVDDEPDVRRSMGDVLRGIPGVTPEEVGSVAEALPLLRARRYDMVVTDERLKDGSGVDLLRWVGARDPVTGLVLMSAHHDDPALLMRAINEARVHHFAKKPWEPAQLAARLRSLLAEQRVFERRLRAFAQASTQAVPAEPASAADAKLWPPS
ncbi:MAG TPA: response regulator [Candidatus Thermoplasmatota archaeon]|nr:response regulator [Candidatus Thermoplasmatota archaeon]